MSHIRSHIDGKAIIKLLIKDGWVKTQQKGSHQQFTHPIKKRKVTIPYKITKNIEKSILKQAGVK